MSSRSTTYTSSNSSSAMTGWPSTLVGLLAILFAVLATAWDVNYHGHFSCETTLSLVKQELARRTHLAAYMKEGQQDRYGQAESGTVECTCDANRKIVLTGKVVNDEIRREFSDVAALATGVGPDKVDNQIETLNVPELEALTALLESEPYKTTVNYQVLDRGTIYLTGDLPNPELKDKITELVKRVRGVRSVVNELGRQLVEQRMLRIHNIYFDFNKWQIREQSQGVLDEVALKVQEFMSSNPSGKVRIEGHTDSIASDAYNKWLSQKRAEACLEALVARGVPRDRLKAIGKGESELLVRPDDTPEKRAENRRIEFYFE